MYPRVLSGPLTTFGLDQEYLSVVCEVGIIWRSVTCCGEAQRVVLGMLTEDPSPVESVCHFI